MRTTDYVSDYLSLAAANFGRRNFLICEDRTLSWSEAYEESNFVASFITSKLAGRQQKPVGILLPDNWQFVVAYFGVVASGNIAMPLDITFKKLELDYVINAVKPEFVIVSRQTRHLVDGPVFLIEDILAEKNTSPLLKFELPPDKQIATLFFSSGTTGQPKPIPNTHQNQIWDVAAIAGPMGWTKADSLLITLHLAHRHGLVVCLFGAVYHANTVYLEERFNAEKTLRLLHSGKISLYSSVPAAYAALVEYAPKTKFDSSKVRLFASSSSALSPQLRTAFKNRFGHAIMDRYGTSETGSIAFINHTARGLQGDIIEGVKIHIENNGEVALKSPGVFPGYYHNATATRKSMTSDGYWRPGDIGELRDGKLILKGRAKEKINRAGYSIFPQDIEWALAQHPGVEEAKVTAVPGAADKLDRQDRVIAFFIGPVKAEALAEFSRLNLPRSWRPDAFVELKKIPKTANGKPRISELKKLAEKVS